MSNNKEKDYGRVAAKAGTIEIVVSGDKDEDVYEFLLSRPQTINLALDVLNTLYKTKEKF